MVTHLEILNDSLVRAYCRLHLLLDVSVLLLELGGFPLLHLQIHQLSVKVVLHELKLQEDVTQGKRGFHALPLGGEHAGRKFAKFRVLEDEVAQVLVLSKVDHFGINEVILSRKTLNRKRYEISAFSAQTFYIQLLLKNLIFTMNRCLREPVERRAARSSL